MVQEGKFREDLYYRLCGVVLEVPSLRERGEDLSLLANHFLEEIADERQEPVKSLTADAFEVLAQHPWPGNVRELQNVLRAASLFADGLLISPEVVRDQIRTPMTHEEEAPCLRRNHVVVRAVPGLHRLRRTRATWRLRPSGRARPALQN